jgi:hypothetical protein
MARVHAVTNARMWILELAITLAQAGLPNPARRFIADAVRGSLTDRPKRTKEKPSSYLSDWRTDQDRTANTYFIEINR